ncbi:MAG TPA: nucleotide exchange factor GrpE [Gammaproteobacteria bacterium]|nr:nucleotide exchange factor GrpE [Gammaproteobacteria bacterium]
MSSKAKAAEEKVEENKHANDAPAGEVEAGSAAAEAAAQGQTAEGQTAEGQTAEGQAVEQEPDLAEQLAEVQTRAENNWNEYLRTAAELENLRKRSQRDVDQAHKFAIERFANEMLSVKDSLEMGLAAAQDAKAEDTIAKLLEGKQMTLKQLETSFEKFGIEAIDPIGQPFNPELHEAMAMQPAGDHKPGTVITVVQKGYSLRGRLLRPARVLVAQETAD